MDEYARRHLATLVIRDYHDEDIEVYINGVLAYSSPGYISSCENRMLNEVGKQSLRSNAENLLAVHCHQTDGGQYIDVGIYEKIP